MKKEHSFKVHAGGCLLRHHVTPHTAPHMTPHMTPTAPFFFARWNNHPEVTMSFLRLSKQVGHLLNLPSCSFGIHVRSQQKVMTPCRSWVMQRANLLFAAETKVILALLLGNLPKSWRDFRFRFFRGDDCERIDVATKISFSDSVSGKNMGLGLE
jgi:hypothetical protein